MNRRPGTAAVTALGLTGILLAGTACGSAPVSPLPVDRPATTPAAHPPDLGSGPPSTAERAPTVRGTPAAVRPAPSTRRGTASPTSSTPDPQGTSPCDGAVHRELDLSDSTVRMQRSMCVGVGSVLLLRNIGPGDNGLSVEPAELVSRAYEAGTVEIRFLRPGTVTVDLPLEGGSHRVIVVVRA